MQLLDNNTQAFLALVRAGLWEIDVQLTQYGRIDFKEIYRLAEEQAVVGLVAAGIEHVVDYKIPKEDALQLVGAALQLEQRNQTLNDFLVWLVKRLNEEHVHPVLVKGQGVAQCYERPAWRASGDIDLLLGPYDYSKAKELLIPFADRVDEEETKNKHQALSISGVEIELHGKMPFLLSKRTDVVIESVIEESVSKGKDKVWRYADTEIVLPSPDNDVILVFTHFLHHFFIEGVGLRQICDWCRLLWTYKDSLDCELLGKRLREMGLMSEWQVFGSLAVNILGISQDAMPFYDDRKCYSRKANRVLSHVLKSGNFGHNNDLSYRTKYSGVAYKLVATWRRFWDFISLVPVFPIDAPKFFVTYVTNKVKGVAS